MAGAIVSTPFARISASLTRAINYSNYAWEMVAPMIPRFGLRGTPRSVNVNGLSIYCDRSLPADNVLKQAWEQLYSRVPTATPFHSPAWQSSVLETAEATRRLRLFTAYDGARLVGILPLEARLGHVLRTSGAVLTDYLDPLIDPQQAGQVWTALLTGLRRLEPGRSILLEHLRPEVCPKDQLEIAARAAGFVIEDSAENTVARIALPKTWDEYLASLDGHERKELKRKIKKAETQGAAALEILTDPATILDEMTRTFELFANCGGGKARKAKWLFPKHFAQSAPVLAASGRLVLYRLMVEQKQAAGLIALPTNQGQILWNTAYDQAMKQWSPGIVMFGMLIRRGIEQKHTVFDLLRGQYEYKYRLGAADYPLHSVTLKPIA